MKKTSLSRSILFELVGALTQHGNELSEEDQSFMSKCNNKVQCIARLLM